jgi:CRP/FNR family transcriptional regulator, cyclic AMP receptor protein
MDDPILTIEEREAINSGRWFSSLSPSLRHDILRCAFVKRYKDGDLIAARGDPPDHWIACAKGAVRVSSTAVSGKQVTLTYVEPGIWFGDVAMFDTTPTRTATAPFFAWRAPTSRRSWPRTWSCTKR